MKHFRWFLLNKLLKFLREGSYERRQILVWLAFAKFPRQIAARWLVARKEPPQAKNSQLQHYGVSRIELPIQTLVEDILDDAKIRSVKHKNRKVSEGGVDPLKIECLEIDTLDLNSPYFRFALDADVTTLVSTYLKEMPILTGIHLWHTDKKNFTRQGLSETQLLHCDGDAQKQLKLFIYITNVAIDSGAMGLLTADQSKIVRKTLKYRYHSNRYRVDDSEIAQAL